ncbi:unnamed protein product [Darwinula stevensoni]|uniref:Uncharacterized protein n=1 Tax=Darwinula stevensoni TaxID=69355 RepID=A0A7R8X8J0_9CRUS|nr:unnamed protein product [Darwinula stevensoni]CAG0884529.1 unnamed protein product [Darwinula stevensoni]
MASREDVANKKRGPFQEDDNSSPYFSHLQQQGRGDFTQFLPCRLTVLIKLPPGLEDPFNFFTFIPLLQSSREDVATKKRGPFQEDDNSSPDFSHLQQQGRGDFTQFLPCRLTVLIKLPPGLEDPFNFFTFIPLLQSSRDDVATKKMAPFQEDDNSSPDFSHLQQQGRGDFTQFLPCRLTVLIKLPPGLEDLFNFFPFFPLLQSSNFPSREDVATKKRGPFQEDDNSSPDFSHLQQQGDFTHQFHPCGLTVLIKLPPGLKDPFDFFAFFPLHSREDIATRRRGPHQEDDKSSQDFSPGTMFTSAVTVMLRKQLGVHDDDQGSEPPSDLACDNPFGTRQHRPVVSEQGLSV